MATKKFVYVKAATDGANWSAIEAGLSTTYFNSIVFRESTKEIFTHGTSFGLSAENAQRITDLESAQAAIEAHLKATTITAAENKGIKVDVTGEADAFKTYTIGAVVDGKTVTVGATGLAATKTLEYVAAAGDVAAHINLKNAAGEVESTIQVSDIVGNGILKSTSYNNAENKLELVFAQADGGDNKVVIDMKELIDINDIFVGADSAKYLEVTNDASTATFDVKIAKVADAADGSTGLADAWDVKSYVDSKSSDLAVSAEGDDYVSASVDAGVDNKHVKVSADVQEISVTAGTAGSYNGEGAQTVAPVHGSLSGVEKSLVDGKQAAEAIKSYVDGEVAIEAARADAKVVAAVKALDKEETVAISDAHVTIKYSETDGIVSIDASTADIASAALLGTAADASSAATAFGAIAKEKAEREEAIAKAIADANKAIENLDVPSNTVDGTNVHVTYKQEDGIVTIESIAADYATVSRTASTSTASTPNETAAIAVTEGSKLVIGSDIEKVAAYAADKVAEEAHRVDKKIADLAGEATSDDAAVATVKVTTAAGQVSDVVVTTNAAGVVAGGDKGARTLTAALATGAVIGSEVAAIKTYVDNVVADNTSDLAVEAAGDTKYIDASVDPANNKKINVAAVTGSITSNKEGENDTTVSGTDNLLTAAEAAAKLGAFANARIAEEIAKLDAEVESTDGTNVAVKVTEADGKVTGVNVTEQYATVEYTASNASTGVGAAFAVTDNTKLVKGKDLEALKSYIEDEFGWLEL